jgi:hypothetical protein
MSKPGLLICVRDNEPIPKPPGSLPMKCSDCGALVTISPSSWQILHDHPELKVVCHVCSPPELSSNLKPYTPDQLEDMIEALEEDDGQRL